MTEHDKQQELRERDQYWARRLMEKRQDLWTACPAGQVVDDDHLATLLHAAPAAHREILIWRRFLRRGLRAAGFGADYVERELGPEPPTVAAIPLGRPSERSVPAAPELLAGTPARRATLYWDPPAELLAEIPEELRPRLIGPRTGS
jgi:hypothetical protein